MLPKGKGRGTNRCKKAKIQEPILVACEYFATEKLEIREESKELLSGLNFILLMCIEGAEKSVTQEGKKALKPVIRLSYLLYMGLCPSRECIILKSYVPDLEADIIRR